MRKQNGITLIALVITIIVLLILAGVSISTIMSDDGIINRANQAKIQTAVGTEKEQLSLSFSDCQMDNLDKIGDDKLVTATQLQTKMNNSYGSGTVEVTGTTTALNVKYLESNRKYLLTQTGMVIAIEDAMANSSDGAIGIAEDGSFVDMSLWKYVYDSEIDGYLLVDVDGYGYYYTGYKGEVIDGKIEGQIPMYILGKDDGNNPTEFKAVKSLEYVFYELEGLKYAPAIPSSVTNIDYAFWWCDTLIEAPIIPENVTSMKRTFCQCTSLATAPVIPSKVAEMNSIFAGCSSLTGELVINANPTSYGEALSSVASNEGCELVLTGSSVMLEEILGTANSLSNVKLAD